MGKDSAFYKDKARSQKLKLKELIALLPKCAQDYIYSKEQTTQPSTLVSYSYDLITFFKFLIQTNPILKDTPVDKIDLSVLSQLTDSDIYEYQRYLELNVDGDYHENGKKAIARKMAPLRGMFEFHYKRGNIMSNPISIVEMPKIKKDKNIVRMDYYEVNSILSAINEGNKFISERQRKYCSRTQSRDLAILSLMLNTGIRVSECNGLDLDDINLNVNTLTIVRKGGGQDILYFNDEIHDVLNTYIEGERKTITPVPGHEKALFYSMQGKRISVDALEQLVKKYASLAVPGKHITPHKLRSTYGTALYRETGDIRLVADVLGHENVDTTARYYAAIEDEHKRRARNAVDYSKKPEE